MKRMLIVAFLISLFLGLYPHKIIASSWISNFNYRKTIEITGSSAGAVAQYPIKFTINKGAGTDTGASVFLNNHVLNSFSDIRFTKSDGVTLLNYWIESSTSDSAIVWIAFDSIPASPLVGSFYLYYGNSSATNEENGANTFTFFEGFDSNGITNWTGSSENIHVSEGTSQSASPIKYRSSPYSAKLYSYANCMTSPWDGAGSIISRSPEIVQGTYKVDFSVLRDIDSFTYGTTAIQRSIVKINGSSSFSESSSCSGDGCTSVGAWGEKSIDVNNSAIDTILLEGYSDDCVTGVTWFDNVRVRKYISPEPSISTWGSQESLITESTTVSQNNSSSSSSTPIASTCNDTPPSNSPDLFQIDVNNSQATLYYVPVSNNVSNYYISYSEKQNEFMYGVETNQGPSSGVLSFTVNALNPHTIYYFRVRAQNGCMPGDWSNEMKVQTKTGGTTQTPYYKNSPFVESSIVPYSLPPTAKSVLGASTNEPSPTLQPTPTSIPKQKKNSQPVQTEKKCFLIWCW